MFDKTICDLIDIELEIEGELYDVAFNRVTKISIDSDYGAVADGHRGVRAEFVESDIASNVTINSVLIEDYAKDFQEKALGAIEQWLEKNPAE